MNTRQRPTKRFSSHPLTLAGLLVVLLMGAPSAAFGNEPQETGDKSTVKTQKDEITAKTQTRVSEKQEEIISEAVEALSETNTALTALEEGDKEKALKALERAAGKFDIILAREPELALAPVEVAVSTIDLYATVKDIETAADRAEKYLEQRRIQKARDLLDGLASEMVISTTNIPLGTFPAAMKTAAAFIDENDLEAAKAHLQTALSTLVTTKVVMPLPFLRAEILLNKAEALAKKEERSKEDKEKLAGYFQDARRQIEKAKALGYGSEKNYDQLVEEIEKLEKRTNLGKSDEGYFARIKSYLSHLTDSFAG